MGEAVGLWGRGCRGVCGRRGGGVGAGEPGAGGAAVRVRLSRSVRAAGGRTREGVAGGWRVEPWAAVAGSSPGRRALARKLGRREVSWRGGVIGWVWALRGAV